MEHDVETIILAFIREHCLPQRMQTSLGIEDHLFETGTIDSAGLIHLIGYIEDRFGIVIPDEDLLPEKFTTVAAMGDYVRGKLREPAAVSGR